MTVLDQAIIKKLFSDDSRTRKMSGFPTQDTGATMSSLLMELGWPVDTAAPLPAAETVAEPTVSQPPAATGPATPAAPRAPWRPLLQVDCVAWPDACNRLQEAAIPAMDQLTEGLAGIVRSGRKVLGFGSATGGEGVTTVMLAAARRLAAQDVRLALVDARLARPALAQTLGLLPQTGWEDSLSGRLPLEEVAVESITDRLTVVPVREAIAGEKGDCPPFPLEGCCTQRGTVPPFPRVAADLDILSRNYDAVLVDLGELEIEAAARTPLGQAIRSRLDAVVLVQSVRSTTPDRLERLQEKLAEAGVACAGTIQNFVAGE